MDGIFGVGLAEMLIIALALFIIGGPENTAKWARELGKMVYKGRKMWADVMAQMEQELGPEGKELMDVTRELGKGARDLRQMSPTKRVLGETMRMVESSVDVKDSGAVKPRSGKSEPASAAEPESAAGASSNGQNDQNQADETKYRAWLPPKDE